MGISTVANVVGKPLYVDLRTEQMKLISFARVYVEISATQPRCNSMDRDLDGESCSVKIKYELRPIACLSCGTFGHKCAPPPTPSSPKGEAQQDSIVELPAPAIQPLTPVSEAAATSNGLGLEWNQVGGRLFRINEAFHFCSEEPEAPKGAEDNSVTATNYIAPSSSDEESDGHASQTELEDLRYVGIHFTWFTSSGASWKLRKIDCVLVNTKWSQEFSYSEASFLDPDISDHTPMIVKVLQPVHRRKPFKFFDLWTKHSNFHAIVTQVWKSLGEGFPVYGLVSKLKTLKGHLKLLNRESFFNISKRVDVEESFFRQKSKIKWLKEGDRNTKFFHHSVNKRYPRNRILSVMDTSGILVSDPAMVQHTFVSHFQELVAPRTLPLRPLLLDVQEVIRHPLSEEQVPGPDRFGVEFFKLNREIVGPLVLEAIKNFFTLGRLLRELNNTILVLMPKVPNASSVNDYRPIACCNTIYKCITKVLANQVAAVLLDVIS
ncbi:uncharacterized protein LOC120289171 [Eucalyptus grandis]|uniref:uncharacterized protein LOC120289171 n=1 Tax=Eucalyptus grandis TaxID=71139 RepID=UPI00192E8E54|nr:uncharacterized protein LOC120289171 [Eucalyptus grandis]